MQETVHTESPSERQPLRFYWRQGVSDEDLTNAVYDHVLALVTSYGYGQEGVGGVKIYLPFILPEDGSLANAHRWVVPINTDEVSDRAMNAFMARWEELEQIWRQDPDILIRTSGDIIHVGYSLDIEDGNIASPAVECILCLPGFDLEELFEDFPDELVELWDKGEFSRVFY
ncbi:MAG: hypothetical protein KC877_01865 [Candidatus Kaiserbacteria bacterium]|nr:hypothetical protein [Candidatus Kaiserbacteria bacterium]MCB9815903.1 hypothetical protein [Candidatus Nomurabacteria bacterium]